MLYVVDKDFKSLLETRFTDHSQCNNLLYGIWSDGRLAYTNSARFDFAKRNNGRSNALDKLKGRDSNAIKIRKYLVGTAATGFAIAAYCIKWNREEQGQFSLQLRSILNDG